MRLLSAPYDAICKSRFSFSVASPPSLSIGGPELRVSRSSVVQACWGVPIPRRPLDKQVVKNIVPAGLVLDSAAMQELWNEETLERQAAHMLMQGVASQAGTSLESRWTVCVFRPALLFAACSRASPGTRLRQGGVVYNKRGKASLFNSRRRLWSVDTTDCRMSPSWPPSTPTGCAA